MSFLVASGVEKSYEVGTSRLPVLKGLDVSLEKGEMVAVVGASGVGKSTLLHVLGGLDAADAGQVQIGETDLTGLSDAAVVAFRNLNVGFVFQFHHLLPEFTALENAEMPMRIARRAHAEARQRSIDLLRRVGLGERLGVAGEPHLGSRDADQRAAHASTHVSLNPPFCVELTTSAPSSRATRVRPPGSTQMSSPSFTAKGRRSACLGRMPSSTSVGMVDSMTTG